MHCLTPAMLARISGEAGAELLGTSRQVGFPAPESLVARGRLEIASESRAGSFRDDIDCAAGGITPVQGTLRPLQHFDTVDIVQVLNQRIGACLIDAIDIHGATGSHGRR